MNNFYCREGEKNMNQIIRKHVRNFCFLLITFATGLFYFCFYLVGITFGVSMSFTLVGIPILYYVLRSTETFYSMSEFELKSIRISRFARSQPDLKKKAACGKGLRQSFWMNITGERF